MIQIMTFQNNAFHASIGEAINPGTIIGEAIKPDSMAGKAINRGSILEQRGIHLTLVTTRGCASLVAWPAHYGLGSLESSGYPSDR